MAAVFVVTFSAAGVVLLFLSVPRLWAVAATIGIVVGTTRLVLDIRGNRAM